MKTAFDAVVATTLVLIQPLGGTKSLDLHAAFIQQVRVFQLESAKRQLHYAQDFSPPDAILIKQRAITRLRWLIRKYPNSPEAIEAKELLRGLPKKE